MNTHIYMSVAIMSLSSLLPPIMWANSRISKLRDYLYPHQNSPTIHEVSGPTSQETSVPTNHETSAPTVQEASVPATQEASEPTIHEVSGPNLAAMSHEMLHMIRDYISPSDTASLALCNRRLLYVLGKNHPISSQHREQFLNTLARDLPKHYYCHVCCRLHPRATLELPGRALSARDGLPCMKDHLCVKDQICMKYQRCMKDEQSMYFDHAIKTISPYTSYRLSFSHLQLAMQRHHLGPEYGIPLESFTYSEVYHVPIGTASKNLFSIQARICPQSLGLYLRIQVWILLRTIQWNAFLRICDHIRLISYEQIFQTGLILKDNNVQRQTKTFTCRKCNMDYQIETMEVTDESIAIVVTKWIDLGAGLTPMDPKWRVHCISSNELGWAVGSESNGDIRSRFESQSGAGPSLHALNGQNLSYLTAKRYKEAMVNHDNRVWTLHGGEPTRSLTGGRCG